MKRIMILGLLAVSINAYSETESSKKSAKATHNYTKEEHMAAMNSCKAQGLVEKNLKKCVKDLLKAKKTSGN